jgi:hypothetical protein
MNFAENINFIYKLFSCSTPVLCSFFVLMGCSNPLDLEENKVPFDGHYFSSKITQNKTDDRYFTLKVRRASRSLSGAREAGRYEATRFCIKNFGTSDIKWALGPDDENVGLTGRILKLRGKCDVS